MQKLAVRINILMRRIVGPLGERGHCRRLSDPAFVGDRRELRAVPSTSWAPQNSRSRFEGTSAANRSCRGPAEKGTVQRIRCGALGLAELKTACGRERASDAHPRPSFSSAVRDGVTLPPNAVEVPDTTSCAGVSILRQRAGTSLVDCRKHQTTAATPAKLGASRRCGSIANFVKGLRNLSEHCVK